MNIKELATNIFNLDSIKEELLSFEKIAEFIFNDNIDFHKLSTIGKIKVVSEIVPVFFRELEKFESLKGKDKESLCVSAVWNLYKKINEKHEIIDIPLIFGSLEVKIERTVIEYLTRTICHIIYKQKKEGI